MVADDVGHLLDRSSNLRPGDSVADSLLSSVSTNKPVAVIQVQGEPWRVARQRVPSVAVSKPKQSKELEGEHKSPFLSVMVGIPLEPVQSALHSLLAILCGLCAVFWLLAAFFGRSMCRSALAPVSRMTAAAHAIRAANLDERLPSTGTRDELEQLSQAFNGLLDRLHESCERQKRFTGDASHQLRTPLTAMLGQVEVTLLRDRPPEEYQRVLNLILGQANRLCQIVEMLLFLAHADAEAKLPHLETLNLADWLNTHLRSWSGHSRKTDLRVERVADIAVLASVHPKLLGQLVDNLLDNACKHSKPGTAITLRLWQEQRTVWLAVEDAGCGISPEDLAHVFEPFYRSSETRRIGISGVGMGLAVVERIANAFGGSIRVKSELGKGSCFLLQLPDIGEVSSSAALQSNSSHKKVVTGTACA